MMKSEVKGKRTFRKLLSKDRKKKRPKLVDLLAGKIKRSKVVKKKATKKKKS